MKSRWLAVLLILGFAAVGTMGMLRALGFKNVHVSAAPAALPPTGFDYTQWNEALSVWVKDGRVDYTRVVAERDVLERFVARLAVTGPNTTPERFPDDAHKLAYYINAYNALVLYAVVAHWPIDTVHDVRGIIEPKAGFGFFYGLRFMLDGKRTNLYNFEHKVIRGFGDARIHAAINCASNSCPPLAPFAFTPGALDHQLTEVTRAFCAPPHVVVDEPARRVALSSIFDWYRGDFVDYAKTLGADPSLSGFIESFAEGPIAESVAKARQDGWTTSFTTYDWRLNQL